VRPLSIIGRIINALSCQLTVVYRNRVHSLFDSITTCLLGDAFPYWQFPVHLTIHVFPLSPLFLSDSLSLILHTLQKKTPLPHHILNNKPSRPPFMPPRRHTHPARTNFLNDLRYLAIRGRTEGVEGLLPLQHRAECLLREEIRGVLHQRLEETQSMAGNREERITSESELGRQERLSSLEKVWRGRGHNAVEAETGKAKE
jgi:hypothetical protein